MLNHKWMPKRDRSIRRSAKDADEPLALDALQDGAEAGGAEANEAQSQEGQDMTPAHAPAGPEATAEHAASEQEQAPEGATQTTAADTAEVVAAAEPPPREDAAAAGEAETGPPAPEEKDAAAHDTAADVAAEPPVDTPETRPAAGRKDARAVADKLQVPQTSLRDRLESVLAHQAQLPLDIDARHAVSAGAEGSPRETRELLLQRLLDPTLTLQEAATLLGVCTTTIRRYTDRGLLRCFRTPGNQRRFHLSDVLDFMEKQQRSG